MKVFVYTCCQCGKELNRSKPLPDDAKASSMMFSAATQCLCDNRSHNTGSDWNLNWNVREEMVES